LAFAPYAFSKGSGAMAGTVAPADGAVESEHARVAPGARHAPATAKAKKADVAEGRQFFEDLAAEVSAGMAQGKSLAELKKSILLEKYKDWSFYPRLREDNIEAAYNNLKLYR